MDRETLAACDADTAFDSALVRDALGGATLLLDDEPVSQSSGKTIHRIVARKNV